MKSTAILDNSFVSKKLLDLVVDAGPIHLGDNRSRHSPVMMKIKVCLRRNQESSNPAVNPKGLTFVVYILALPKL